MLLSPRISKNLFSVIALVIASCISVDSAYAQDYKPNEIVAPKVLKSEKVLMPGKTTDGVSLNPQPVPPKDMEGTLKKKNQIKQMIRKKAIVADHASPEMENAGIQKMSGSVQVHIARGYMGLGMSTADFKRLCPKVNVFAKRADGEMHKFTPSHYATNPAFGLPGRSWCETERITIPANEDIHFIATIIDDQYKVTPATEQVSIELNEAKNVVFKMVAKKRER